LINDEKENKRGWREREEQPSNPNAKVCGWKENSARTCRGTREGETQSEIVSPKKSREKEETYGSNSKGST